MAAGNERLFPTKLTVDDSSWIAPGAVVVGEVTIGPGSSVWYGCVLRGDLEPIRIGAGTNVQDLTIVHVDRAMPALVGDRVTIGHRCVIHGCTIGDDAVIGIGAVVLSGSKVGPGALVAAGAVVREGFEVPPGTLAAGVPAAIRGKVDPALRRRFDDGVANYIERARRYREGELGAGPHGGRR